MGCIILKCFIILISTVSVVLSEQSKNDNAYVTQTSDVGNLRWPIIVLLFIVCLEPLLCLKLSSWVFSRGQKCY